ncbi:MAG: class I SAM-dependent methyltransferase, partial [Proteobacteria bacterium]|nr:class I SAM-dependent methyltransferase [Pseudomonadota bacterium]
MKSLRTLYEEQRGKVSDKWSLYIDVYDRLLAPLRERPVTLVEVGVQNGGSLEIWPRYFPNGTAFIGCDIDPKCAALSYDDARISVIVGNINSDAASQAILARAQSWDIFIDDGSHTSHDIIISFCNYFRFLKPGGLYIVEDLHCSYWPPYGGGIVCATSSMSFFKLLCDMLNYEHWKTEIAAESLLATFFPGVNRPNFSLFSEIFSLTFFNSMCIIEKCREGQSA